MHWCRCVMQTVLPGISSCCNLFIVSWASVCHAVWLGKRSDLCCIWLSMGDLLLGVSKCIKQWAVIELLTHENGSVIKTDQWLLALCGKGTVDIRTVHCWVRKLRDNGGNLELNSKLQSGRPGSATHNLNRQKWTKLFKKINEFLREP
jgi:hypothetical protein